jgi:hypothetical protein
MLKENTMNPQGKIAAFAALWAITGAVGAVGMIADVSVYDRAENRKLAVYQHQGRYSIVGKPGNEYQIRVRNRSGGDILAVMSVDGVNVVSGETASWEQTGYVLSPRQSYDVRGWRKSMERIATFFFTGHANSYAARTGRPDHTGVIGVAVFRKMPTPEARLPYPPLRRDRGEEGTGTSPYPATMDESAGSGERLADSAVRSAAAEHRPGQHHAPVPAQPESRLGTGHGRSEVSHRVRACNGAAGGSHCPALRFLRQSACAGRDTCAAACPASAVSGAVRA